MVDDKWEVFNSLEKMPPGKAMPLPGKPPQYQQPIMTTPAMPMPHEPISYCKPYSHMPAQAGALPYQAAPVHSPKSYSSTADILVLFVLLVIISRGAHDAIDYYHKAKVCKK